jgi:Ubiquitin-protein ligase
MGGSGRTFPNLGDHSADRTSQLREGRTSTTTYTFNLYNLSHSICTSPASSTATALSRLRKELKASIKEPENETYLYLRPVEEDDLLLWEAVLKGPDDTPYEGKLTNPNFPAAAIPVNLTRQQVDFGAFALQSRQNTPRSRRPSTSRLR